MEKESRILFILPQYFSELVLASVTECNIDAELTSHNSAVWWAELNIGSGHRSPGLIQLLFAFISHFSSYVCAEDSSRSTR